MTDIDFSCYYQGLSELIGNDSFERWRDSLPSLISSALSPSWHGDIAKWHGVLNQLPEIKEGNKEFDAAAISIAKDTRADQDEQTRLREILMQLKPWRKGPFRIFEQYIDAEWRSDMKWDRLVPHIDSLQDRLVLDVGCGNGYHCWRMRGAGAKAVIGVDPMLLYIMQFCAIQHFMRSRNVFVLPTILEALPDRLQCFDTVFSMGVLYHQRSPIEHLLALKSCLTPGGQLVLETLIVEESALLVPVKRYARMKNVWFITDTETVKVWLKRCGYKDIKLVDVARTSIEEQRTTPWTGDKSLKDFLDSKDSAKTVEGYPAPVRAIFTATG